MDIFRSVAKGSVKVFGPLPLVDVGIAGIDLDDNWALIDMRVNHQEILDVRQCFNNTAFLFCLGNNLAQGAIDLVFLVFLSAEGCSSKAAYASLAQGIDEYKKSRVSQVMTDYQITIGELSLFGWLKGMQAYGFDAAKGTCYVSMSFLAKME